MTRVGSCSANSPSCSAKLFKNGQSQAVRLPKAFRMPGKEVKISKDGNRVILEPVNMSCAEWLKVLDQFSPDFKIERNQPLAPPNRVFFK